MLDFEAIDGAHAHVVRSVVVYFDADGGQRWSATFDAPVETARVCEDGTVAVETAAGDHRL